MRSKKPKARYFTRWVYETVLPGLNRDLLHEYMEKCRDDGDELSLLKLEGLRGYVYLATTPTRRERNTYKIGRTSNPDKRLGNLNALERKDDKFSYLGLWATADCCEAERLVFERLAESRQHKEFFEFDNDSTAVNCVDLLMTSLL